MATLSLEVNSEMLCPGANLSVFSQINSVRVLRETLVSFTVQENH